MPSAPNELRVVSLCSYLTGELKARSIDWPAIKMVKALKGDPINGYFDLSVEGVAHRFNKDNVGQFLDLVPRAMAAAILPRIEGTATLVPIPNSHVLSAGRAEFLYPQARNRNSRREWWAAKGRRRIGVHKTPRKGSKGRSSRCRSFARGLQDRREY